ncbi:MAG: 4-coumarate--CoA ligase family protein [Acidimicrobiia bacterium]|nr:4-coumarate--CoA ligase family protein [Acidimicrobiia bacterium]
MYTSPLPDVEIPQLPISDYVLRLSSELGDKAALIDGPTGRTLTFSGLADSVKRFASGLAARGFGQGDVMAIYSPNVPEYAVVFHAVASLGGINTTINPLYTPAELAHQLTDSGAKCLFTIPQFLESATEAASLAGVADIIVLGDGDGATPYGDILSAAANPPDVSIEPDDLAALPYSSGTTGLSKGVMLTHRNLVANIQQCLPVLNVGPEDTVIAVLPFFHIYGMQVIMNMAVSQGATVVSMPRFDLEGFLGLVQDHKVTVAYLVPPVVLGLAKHPAVDGFDLSSLRLIMSGAAPLSAELQEACAARLECTVMQGYGLTETSPVTHVNPPEANRPGTVGIALPLTECRIVDAVTEEDAAMGEKGELWMRGPQVMAGYLNNEVATKTSIDPDGWFHSGDLATIDADGYYTIVDRLKELIKFKGFQVAPAELEGLLLTHPAVADAAVIPSPDDEAGEVPKGFVVLKQDTSASADEIMDWVAGEVAPHKKIRLLEIVDEIPKSASGKILRRILVERERASRRAS